MGGIQIPMKLNSRFHTYIPILFVGAVGWRPGVGWQICATLRYLVSLNRDNCFLYFDRVLFCDMTAR